MSPIHIQIFMLRYRIMNQLFNGIARALKEFVIMSGRVEKFWKDQVHGL